MDLALINLGGRTELYQQFGVELTAVEPPSCLLTEDISRYGAVKFADGGWIKTFNEKNKNRCWTNKC